MSYGNYDQYDSRWGGKNYNGSSTVSSAGCGPVSCANILHNVDPAITPIQTIKFMQTHGYAIRNNGTAHAGIPACLTHFGAKNVSQPNVSESMSKVWELMGKGYVAIFLMKNGSRGGITWTSSGHYIAVIGYKYKDKKHYVKVEDCGGRKHDGWYCYETQMRGLIPKVWTCLAKPKEIKPVPLPTGAYNGDIAQPTLKYGSTGSNVKLLQMFLNWYGNFGLKADGQFGEKTSEALLRFQKTEGLATDAIYGSKSYAAAKKYKTSSTPHADAIVESAKKIAWPLGTPTKKYDYDHGAPTSACKTAMKKRGFKSKIDWSDCGKFLDTLNYMALKVKTKMLPSNPKTAFSKTHKGLVLVHNGGSITRKELKAGDEVDYKKTNGAQHALTIMPNNQIAEGGRGIRFPIIKTDEGKYKGKKVRTSTIQVWRAKE